MCDQPNTVGEHVVGLAPASQALNDFGMPARLLCKADKSKSCCEFAAATVGNSSLDVGGDVLRFGSDEAAASSA